MEEIKNILEELDSYGVKVEIDKSQPNFSSWAYSSHPNSSYGKPYNKIIKIGYLWHKEHIIAELNFNLKYIRGYIKSRKVKDENLISFIENFQYNHDKD